MERRQYPVPRQWLVADERLGDQLWSAVRRLPRGSGVLALYRGLRRAERARLMSRIRRIAAQRGLTVADEAAGEAARVHNLRELRDAGLARVPLLFLSPIFATRSHPDWRPHSRMRAAALTRLAGVPVIALGGMDEERFRRIERLGFHGWAGIESWIRT